MNPSMLNEFSVIANAIKEHHEGRIFFCNFLLLKKGNPWTKKGYCIHISTNNEKGKGGVEFRLT